MLVLIEDKELKELFLTPKKKVKSKFSYDIIEKFKKRVLQLKQIENTTQLRKFRSFNFEALRGNKKGLYSIRSNKEYRLEFTIEKDKVKVIEIIRIQKLSKHSE